MLSLRCVRWVGWLLLPGLIACSNGRGSVDEEPPPAPGAQDGFTVGGNVSGLVGSGLVLQNNGAGDLPIAADGAFTFTSRFATGTAYSVAVVSHPTAPSQTCSVARGNGSIAGANVADVAVTCATGQFSIRGTVSGLTGAGLVLQNNGGNDLPISAAGTFAFANKLVDGATYTVTVRTQPTGQNCVVRNPSGTIRGADASNVEVACASNRFTIGGRVTGLAGSGLSLQLNGGNDLSIVGNGVFAFETALQSGAAYQVSVRRQPSNPSQVCTVSNNAGTVAGGNVTNIAVNCVSSSFTIGGTVSGLAGSGLVLQLNGDGDLPIASNGSFTFATPLSSGSQYRVNVAAQPSNPTQVCTVASGSGTVGGTNVTNVRVSCASSTFSVGGTVIGLMGSGLVLQNNGADDLPVGADGLFTFPAELASGATYNVTVRTQPTDPNQACTVTNARGTIGNSDVGNVVVSCSTSDFSIGGTVRNLEGSHLVLRNNGGDELTIDAGGTFVFDTALPSGARYDVTIAEQPRDPNQVCTVSNGSGFVGSGNVTNIVIDCETPDFSIGGRVERLGGLGGLVLQNNGGDDLEIAANGRFTFPTRLPSGASYNVTIRRQPLFDRCEVRKGSGTVRDKNIDNVEVRCDRDDDD
jgi:trimeric autotransporter adhesin